GHEGRLKLWAALLAWLLCVVCPASCDVLVLIQPATAGPKIDLRTYTHPNWILWPRETNPATHSALFSLVTGHEWHGFGGDSGLRFPGAMVALLPAAYELDSRGVFELRRKLLGRKPTFVFPDRKGRMRETSLLLGLGDGSGKVAIQRDPKKWPAGGVGFHDATS